MPKIHKTVQGETFDSLALLYFNEETLASNIIAANLDYCDVLIFDAGVELIIPDEADVELPETLPPWRRDG